MSETEVLDDVGEGVSIVGKQPVDVLYFLWGQFDAQAGRKHCLFREGSRSMSLWRDGFDEYQRRAKDRIS